MGSIMEKKKLVTNFVCQCKNVYHEQKYLQTKNGYPQLINTLLDLVSVGS